MSATVLAAMIVEGVELRTRPSLVKFAFHPMQCEHMWEPHLIETGKAYCPRCGSAATWVNDPRVLVEAAS